MTDASFPDSRRLSDSAPLPAAWERAADRARLEVASLSAEAMAKEEAEASRKREEEIEEKQRKLEARERAARREETRCRVSRR